MGLRGGEAGCELVRRSQADGWEQVLEITSYCSVDFPRRANCWMPLLWSIKVSYEQSLGNDSIFLI